ncbi:hypothetical protein BDN67DRAFT_972803 [Paxillus ammoniavirescens]|nr:hypothetical protein BDN67DRAFT_972803 [Paxillus ammoniavirescens]
MGSCSCVHSEHMEPVGRISIGPNSDLTRNRPHLPRANCLCIVSSLFIISQAFVIGI